MKQLLLIDDDWELCALLREYLESEELHCTTAGTGTEGLRLATGQPWDMVILDVMLPEKNGFEVLSALRSTPSTARLPVLMLTARGDDVDRVVGLEMGADDYLPKPFNPRELLARIRAVLRRIEPPGESLGKRKSVGDLSLDEDGFRMQVGEETVDLTGVEFRLLQLLLETPGALQSRERLALEGLGRPLRAFDRSLDMHISRIRKKLGLAADGSERIRSVRSEGYVYAARGARS